MNRKSKSLLAAMIGTTGLIGCSNTNPAGSYEVYSNSVIAGERGSYRIESEPEYVFSKIDLVNAEGKLANDGVVDVYALGSVYVNPSIKDFWSASEGLPALFREGAPGIRIYYTPEFAENLRNNPSLLKSLNGIVSTKYDISPKTLTRKELEKIETDGARSLLPRNHLQKMPKGRKIYLEGIENDDPEIMRLIEEQMEFYSRMAEEQN